MAARCRATIPNLGKFVLNISRRMYMKAILGTKSKKKKKCLSRRKLVYSKFNIGVHSDQKKSPNVYKSCPKMISLEKC